MNKLTKFFAFAGLTSAIAYVAVGLKGKPISNLKNTQKDSRDDATKISNSDTGKRSGNGSKPVTDYSNSRTQKMYKDLGMTEEQKRRYERDYKTVMETWEKSNPNYNINEQQKIDEHNSVLSTVLNEAQFSMYRDWFKKNPA